ncbi:MAG: hypothetical protein Q8891_12105 [Bacteroidota bacterium]|nr:hypothetical protein [Bacteroidota bacterium]
MKKFMLFSGAFVILFAAFSLKVNAQQINQHQKVNIVNFKVVENHNKVSVNWATDDKTPTNYFELEKSNDGKNFKTVAYILGADPTKTDCDCYGCFDKVNTNKKELYYRLKHVSTDGEVEFSETRMLAINN